MAPCGGKGTPPRQRQGHRGSGFWFLKSSEANSSKMAGLSQAFPPELVTSQLR